MIEQNEPDRIKNLKFTIANFKSTEEQTKKARELSEWYLAHIPPSIPRGDASPVMHRQVKQKEEIGEKKVEEKSHDDHGGEELVEGQEDDVIY